MSGPGEQLRRLMRGKSTPIHSIFENLAIVAVVGDTSCNASFGSIVRGFTFDHFESRLVVVGFD